MEMRELKKKKALKKQARLQVSVKLLSCVLPYACLWPLPVTRVSPQEIEEVRETEKSRWKNFTDKVSYK